MTVQSIWGVVQTAVVQTSQVVQLGGSPNGGSPDVIGSPIGGSPTVQTGVEVDPLVNNQTKYTRHDSVKGFYACIEKVKIWSGVTDPSQTDTQTTEYSATQLV